MTMIELDPEDKQKRIQCLMECTKEFIEYKIANDISRFFEDVRSEKSDEIHGSKIREAIKGNILYIDWLKKETSKSKKLAMQK